MKTTIDYGSDYGGQPSDYQTTMTKNLVEAGDYRLCPLKAAREPVLAFFNTDISG